MTPARDILRKDLPLLGALAVAGIGLAAQLALAEFAGPLPEAPRPAPGRADWAVLWEAPQHPLNRTGQELDLRKVSDALVRAIVELESGGNPSRVGSAGERGLMQIKAETWRETTQKLFGEALAFDRAFEPELNLRVGRAYLATLQAFLQTQRGAWRADERALLLCAYNAGPGALSRAGFDPAALAPSVQDYAERGAALHEWFLESDAEPVRQRLLAALAQPGVDSASRLR